MASMKTLSLFFLTRIISTGFTIESWKSYTIYSDFQLSSGARDNVLESGSMLQTVTGSILNIATEILPGGLWPWGQLSL
jgi:hypothetical protein